MFLLLLFLLHHLIFFYISEVIEMKDGEKIGVYTMENSMKSGKSNTYSMSPIR